MFRALISVCLSVSLLLTGIGAAVAGGAAPAVDRVVICSGHATTVLFVDAEGTPTSAPHLCPDCAMHLLAGVPASDAEPTFVAPSQSVTISLLPPLARGDKISATRARGPPLAV